MSARFCHERGETHDFDVVRGRANAARHCSKCPMISLDWDDVSVCRHCGRVIVNHPDDGWVDPAASGDDIIWRETCESHDTFVAEHEPAEQCPECEFSDTYTDDGVLICRTCEFETSEGR